MIFLIREQGGDKKCWASWRAWWTVVIHMLGIMESMVDVGDTQHMLDIMESIVVIHELGIVESLVSIYVQGILGKHSADTRDG